MRVVDADRLGIVLLIGHHRVVELRAEVVEAQGRVVASRQREGLRKASPDGQRLLHAVERPARAGHGGVVGNHDGASGGQDADVIRDDVRRAVTQTRRTAENGRRRDVPLDMAPRRQEETVVVVVVVAPDTGHERELVLYIIGILGIGAHLAFVAVEHVVTQRRVGDPRRGIAQILAVIGEAPLHPDVERRAVGEPVGVHQVARDGVFVAAVVVQSEVGRLVEVVEVDDERDVRPLLVLLVGVVDGRSDGHAHLEVAVRTPVTDVRPVEGHLRPGLVPVVAHRLAHLPRIFIPDHAAEPVLLYELPAPADLCAVVGGIEPLVGHVDLVGERQIAESVAVVVHLPHVGVHRTVEQDHARQLLVLRHREGRRDVGLGTQLVVEVEVDEQPLVVRRFAVLEVDLARDGLVSGRHRRHALRHLNRIEPHAGRIAQAVGGAQAAHDRTVFVEDLRIGARKAQHLDLPRTRDGVAVADGHRRRVFERLGEVAAGHLAEPRERDHLVLEDAVALHVVAALRTLDHDALELHALRAEREVDGTSAGGDPHRVVDITQIGGYEPVVALDPMDEVRPRRIGARPDGGSGPVDRCADEGLSVGIAHRTPHILRTHGAGSGEGRQKENNE